MPERVRESSGDPLALTEQHRLRTALNPLTPCHSTQSFGPLFEWETSVGMKKTISAFATVSAMFLASCSGTETDSSQSQETAQAGSEVGDFALDVVDVADPSSVTEVEMPDYEGRKQVSVTADVANNSEEGVDLACKQTLRSRSRPMAPRGATSATWSAYPATRSVVTCSPRRDEADDLGVAHAGRSAADGLVCLARLRPEYLRGSSAPVAGSGALRGSPRAGKNFSAARRSNRALTARASSGAYTMRTST
mgnify:FL=1